MGELFHENLRKIRLQKGLSQKDVAEQIGVAKSTYSLYEIADVLNTSADTLLGIDDYDSSTLAAHFDGDDYTADELEEIKRFAEFVKNKRK